MRQPFLITPNRWTQADRVSQSPADYASAVQRFEPRGSWWEAMARVFAVAFIAASIAVFFS